MEARAYKHTHHVHVYNHNDIGYNKACSHALTVAPRFRLHYYY